MPKVKIVWSNHISLDHGDSDVAVMASPISDWEELTDDELDFLQKNLHFLRHPSGDYHYRPHILVDRGPTPRQFLNTVIEAKRVYDERTAKTVKIMEQAQKKRAKTARERRKAQFEKLKKEFEAKQ